MNTVYIREMYIEDIPEVVSIERLSFSMPWSETSFRSEIYSRYSITRVAELNGIVVGYICVKHVADECHLLNLAVHPDYRRRGIAKVLLDNMIRELKIEGCRFFYLEVRASNYAARRLYEGVGFNMVGIRKGYYVNPVEDAIIMMKEL
ncbi:ribosomal-protein-alanine acetyltransferase [Dissulfurispira thermophila]|uniref:[Ribosomal protein bS18]-alanine N-acetyltransferase n=1 Tax=Dissulfurispira thermophila TaxID=2715679 RepID=A0A7G1H0N1_9BACT|nr:ribosomal protein S18-alanine N-acetyltransferase [Dissulfurispira thermophila]BCB95839.1 ribosomal-protein-alanine acetyltransferase [Dissulfurispira thermophila]